MTNAKEYTEKELETKLDSLMNEDDNWLDDCFGGLGDITDEEAEAERESIKLAQFNERYNKTFKRIPLHNCGRCGGTGILPAYMHRSRGKCYPCNGSGKQLSKPKEKKEIIIAKEFLK